MISTPPAAARPLSVVDAASTVVGIIVGSGIFFAPAAIAKVAPHPAAAALLWFLGAGVAGFGALCYAECAARLPHNGGFVVFYERAWGRDCAFITGWAAVLLTYPASLAGISVVGAIHLGEAVGALKPYPAAVAGGMLLVAGALNAMGIKITARSQRALTLAKVGALAALALAVLTSAPGAEAAAQVWNQPALAPEVGLLTAFAVLMWTFDGWTDVTLITGEVQDPGRSLVRAVIWGLGTVGAIYALIQVAVMVLLPGTAGEADQVVAVATARALGPGAGRGVAWLVALATMGSVHSCVFVVSRLVAAMARQGALPRALAGAPGATPVRAVATVVALGGLFVASQGLADLVRLFSFVVWLFYGLTALTLVRLRQTGVGDPLPFTVRGGQLSPWVLLAAALLMTGLQVSERPQVAVPGLAAVALTAVVLRWRAFKSRTTTHSHRRG